MFNSDIITTFDLQNEHNFEHNFAVMTNFKTPKIYTANGDLKKRWYVYFSFRNPKTGKFQRMKNIYGIANKFKTKEDRLYILSTYCRNLLKLLKEGFNPFEDNTELIAKKEQRKTVALDNKLETTIENNTSVEKELKLKKNEELSIAMTLKEAFEFALQIKEKTVSERTFKDYSAKSKKFLGWLKKNYPNLKTIDQLSKKEVQSYLNFILAKTSARNRNNYRVELSSLIQVLVDNDIIKSNMVKLIKTLKSKPERNKTYSKDKQEEIYNYLEHHDPHLLLFIKFISYNLLRPIEVCRVKIKDINIKQKTISFKAKNKVLKTKIIPNILLDDLPDLSNCNQDDYLFTPHKIGGHWEANENNRRDYFSKRFKKVVKEHFGLDENYGLYSFRHTFITKLYRNLANDYSPNEAKSRLMRITGHTTMNALEAYLRDIDAELAEDYSELLK
jgi:integrase